jgi:surfactin synthase thioesterase subunit
MTANRWLRRPQPHPNPSLRLFCIPHAGGTPTLYRDWPALLPPGVELVLVCPPGRAERLDDPIPADLSGLVSELAEAAAPQLDRPWAVFGHSMGAAVAHELVLRLVRDGRRAPVHLFASARGAPQYHRPGTVHLGGDDALRAELVRLGGTDSALLELPELMALVLPALRGDYRLIETYGARPDGLLPCPVTALVGIDDTELTVTEAEGWRDWTSEPFQLLTFPGGHFYLSDRPAEVVGAVCRRLGPCW